MIANKIKESRSAYIKLPVIITPELSESSCDIETDIVKVRSEKIENTEIFPFLRRNSLIRREPKKKKIEPENDEKFRDFVEILSKTFARLDAETSGRIVKEEDIQKETRRISSILNPELSDHSRHLSTSINENQGSSSPTYKKSILTAKALNSPKSNPNSRKNSENLSGGIANIKVRIIRPSK